MPQRITLIAAVAENGCIGAGNAMPWHLPEDFAFFKKYTLGKPVVMGRKTWDSLPRKPLPGRKNIVITRHSDLSADGAIIVSDIGAALSLLANEAEIIIMGGAQIYEQTLPAATDLRITRIRKSVHGDAFFPEIDLSDWQEVSREPHHDETQQLSFDFIHYIRR